MNSNVVQGYPSSIKVKSRPRQEEIRKPYGRFSCASSRNMGASVEDQEAPYLLIFIELAPSKNDQLLRSVSGPHSRNMGPSVQD